MNTIEENKSAAYFYHHPLYHYNCAQAVTYKWTGDKDLAFLMKKKGSGQAEKGYCGALHAALTIADTPSKKEKILTAFTAITGSPYCRQIRSMGKTSCKSCVEIADKLLRENI
jgi:hypothetical protein